VGGARGAPVSTPFFCKLNFSRCCACFLECPIPSNVLLGLVLALLSSVLVGGRGGRNFGRSLLPLPGVTSAIAATSSALAPRPRGSPPDQAALVPGSLTQTPLSGFPLKSLVYSTPLPASPVLSPLGSLDTSAHKSHAPAIAPAGVAGARPRVAQGAKRGLASWRCSVFGAKTRVPRPPPPPSSPYALLNYARECLD
jgi:hypothetical protein